MLSLAQRNTVIMLFDKIKRVKAFVFDVDGVLTDGHVLVSASGEQLRVFNAKDGYALSLAARSGYPIAIINERGSPGVKVWMEELGVKDIYIGIDDKKTELLDWLRQNDLNSDDVLYMGEDIPDLAAMEMVGFPVCPADAVEEVKAAAAYVSFRNGGAGAVRDVIEKVMKLHGTWDEGVGRKLEVRG